MSKHKAKLAKLKLKERIDDYERIKGDKKAFKRPGSLNVKKN